jgi:hypothetical protein
MKTISGLGMGVFALLGMARAEQVDQVALANEIDSLRNAVSLLQNRLAQSGEHTSIPSSAAPPPGDSALAPSDTSARELATKADVDGIRADLENYKYENQRNRETTTALVTRGTTIGGTIQARASGIKPESNSGSASIAAPRNSSFDIPSATVNFSGNLFRDYSLGRNLDFKLQLSYARNSPATDASQFNLQDSYLRYNVLSTTGLENFVLNVTLGQQLVAFGLEAQTGEELRPVINSAQFLAGTGIGKRQAGLIIRGDLFPYVDYGFNYRAPLFEYALGMVTGAGPNKFDDNDSKDVTGRLALTLPVDYHSLLREFKVGGSFYLGHKVISKNVTTTVGTATTVSTVVADPYAKQQRFGADVYYNHDPFGITYEYVRAQDGAWFAAKAAKAKQPAVAAHEEDVKGEGHVVTAFFTIGNQWVKAYRAKAKYDDWWPQSIQFFARYDYWDADRNSDATFDAKVYTGGVNWFFAQTTKLQLNYNVYDYQDPAKKEGKEILGQLQFGF